MTQDPFVLGALLAQCKKRLLTQRVDNQACFLHTRTIKSSGCNGHTIIEKKGPSEVI